MGFQVWDDTSWENKYEEDHNNYLVMPYMPGAREDRGRVFGLETYVQLVTNTSGTRSVIVFDPHSEVTSKMFDKWGSAGGLKIFSVADLVRQRPWAFEGYDFVIAPDEGATGRAQSVADVLGVPVVQVVKSRDFETGKILGFEVPEVDETKKYLIVDDIVDAGGTFFGVAEKLNLPAENLDLYVSHGVFSKGTAELEKKFGRIITTNSYLSEAVLDGVLRKNGVEVLDVIHPMIDLIK